MSSLKPDIMVNPSDLFVQTGNVAGTVPYMTQTPELGVRAVTGDGREFRYQQAGASNLVLGTLQQSPAIVANHQNLVTSTAAIGATTITVTLGGTAATANQYAGGTLIFNAGTGIGQTLKISSHPAQATTTGTLVLTLEDPVVVATATASTKSSLYPNLYSGTIQCPTTLTGQPIGVPLFNVTALYYAWIQIKGAASVLNQGGTAVGLSMAPSASVAGALATVAATTQELATALQAGVDGESRLVSLELV